MAGWVCCCWILSILFKSDEWLSCRTGIPTRFQIILGHFIEECQMGQPDSAWANDIRQERLQGGKYGLGAGTISTFLRPSPHSPKRVTAIFFLYQILQLPKGESSAINTFPRCGKVGLQSLCLRSCKLPQNPNERQSIQKDNFSGYRILSWQICPLQRFNCLPTPFLLSAPR